MRARFVLLIAASLALAPSFARAGGNDEATKHYALGKKLLQENKPEAALAELEASLALLPSPNTSLLRAHALRLSNRKAEALEAYEGVIESAGAQLRKGEKRFQATLEEAGKWGATMKAELAIVVVLIHAPAEGTEVAIGGRKIEGVGDAGAAKTMRYRAAADPGNVSVEIKAPGTTTQAKSATAPAGEETTLRFEANRAVPKLAPVVEAPVAEAPPADAVVKDEKSDGHRGPALASVVLGGVGVLGVAGFAIFGSMAHAKKSELDACSPACPSSLEDDASAGKRDQVIADVALFGGLAALGAGAVIWITRPKEKTDEVPTTSLVLGPSFIGARGRF